MLQIVVLWQKAQVRYAVSYQLTWSNKADGECDDDAGSAAAAGVVPIH